MSRCQSYVYKPEQLRRTGRGKSGFERHYTRMRCKRKAADHQKLCWQHAGQYLLLICGHRTSEDCDCMEINGIIMRPPAESVARTTRGLEGEGL